VKDRYQIGLLIVWKNGGPVGYSLFWTCLEVINIM